MNWEKAESAKQMRPHADASIDLYLNFIFILFQLYLRIFFSVILCPEYDTGNFWAGSSFE